MPLALGILCFVAIIAALIAKFVLHLEFKTSAESLEYDPTACYGNWAAHRACPQKLPSSCDHRGALTDCEFDRDELLAAIADGAGFGVSGFCGTCGELVDRTYEGPRTIAEKN
jgi:hypothetical protein